MVELVIEQEKLPLDAVWYHYRSESFTGHKYSLIISLEEKAVLDLIESYAGVHIKDSELDKRILAKDAVKLSLGLIWNLLLFFKKNGYVDGNRESTSCWTINNIKEVIIKDGFLTITGSASCD